MRELKSMGSRVKKAGKNGLRNFLPILLLFFVFAMTGCGSKSSVNETTGENQSTTAVGDVSAPDGSNAAASSSEAFVDVSIKTDPTGEASPYLETEGDDPTASSEDATNAPEETTPEQTKPEETTPEETKAVKPIVFENCSELVFATPRISLLNFREKPSKDGKILAQIPAGTALQRTGRSEEWSRVIYGTTEGFVAAEFVSTTAPVIDLYGAKVQVCDEEFYTTDKLNFRERPSKDGAIIQVLDRAEKVRCTGLGEEWSRIIYNEKEGFVSTQFLSKEKPAPIEPVVQPGGNETENPPIELPAEPGFTDCNEQIRVTTNLRMREGPSTVANVITVLNNGTEVLCTGKSDKWARITYNGRTGYVSLDYVTSVGATTQENPGQQTTTWSIGKITRKETANGILYTGNGGPLIAIDPGHQAHGNSELEPNGPGSTTMKKKVSTGTSGRATGMAESMLDLIVSLQLKDALLARGYNVLMIRETQDVDISNMQRAVRASASGAAVMIRVHANGSSDPNKTGAETLSPSKKNPYLPADLITASERLSKCVIDAFCASTGSKNNNIYYTDTMTGINYATLPTTTIEMGYMTNLEEDALMATADFQVKAVVGIMNGLDAYFGR